MQGPILRKYGVQTTINFQLFETDGLDFKTDASHASGDTTIMKDEGAEANTTNGFTDEGQGYSIVLTATEMQAARIVIYVVDQSSTKVWLDTAIVIETYGNASAQHAFDLDAATQDVNVSQISGDSTAADNLESYCDGGDRIPADVEEIGAGIITASALASGAIDADAIASDVDTYQAKVWLIDDNDNIYDRYVCVWFKNAQPITSGITSPTIQVIKASDGSDLVGATSMTQIASTGLYRYDENSNRVADGAQHIAKVTATIDSATRTWYQPVGRDS